MKEKTFSNSGLNTYKSCPAAYYLKYVRNLVSDRRKDDLVYGKEVIHPMFDDFYLTYLETKDVEKSKLKAKIEMKKNYMKAKINHEVKTAETALKFLNDVIDLYALHLKGKASPEQEFIYNLFIFKNIQIKFTGRIDLIIETNRGLEIYDFKTVSKIGGTYYVKEEMQSQFITYCYFKNISKFFLVPLHCTKTPSACAPFLFTYEKEARNLWLEETKQIIKGILQRESMLGKLSPNILFPRYRTMCTGTFGCGYLPICKEGSLDSIVDGFRNYKEEEKKNVK